MATAATASSATAATASVRDVVRNTPSGSVATVGAGTHSFANFESDNVGLDARGKAGFRGAGVGSTVIRMTPYTSTKRSLVPTAKGTSNPLYLMALNGSPVVSGFTLQGTSQGHLYSGLKIQNASSARVSNVKVAAIPGSGYVPPGETFALNDQRSNGSVYSDVEIDGAGVTSTAFGTNSSTNVTVNRGYFHDSPGSAGAAFWQTKGIAINDVRSVRNRTGLNFERCSGTITVRRPSLQNISNQDIYIGSDWSNSTINIHDPSYSGTHLRIRVPAVYHGVTNRQLRSSVHVYVNGVERTSSVVRWI